MWPNQAQTPKQVIFRLFFLLQDVKLLCPGLDSVASNILSSVKALEAELRNTGSSLSGNIQTAGDDNKVGLEGIIAKLASLDSNNKASLDLVAGNLVSSVAKLEAERAAATSEFRKQDQKLKEACDAL